MGLPVPGCLIYLGQLPQNPDVGRPSILARSGECFFSRPLAFPACYLYFRSSLKAGTSCAKLPVAAHASDTPFHLA